MELKSEILEQPFYIDFLLFFYCFFFFYNFILNRPLFEHFFSSQYLLLFYGSASIQVPLGSKICGDGSGCTDKKAPFEACTTGFCGIF